MNVKERKTDNPLKHIKPEYSHLVKYSKPGEPLVDIPESSEEAERMPLAKAWSELMGDSY